MKVIVSGGGTGGHIYPALALVRIIKEKNPDAEFLYIGTEKGLESKIVPKQNIPFETIEIQGFQRSLSLNNIKTVLLFLRSIKKAKEMIKQFNPDIVIGTGGYVCGSVVYAAHQLKIPAIIHEQNSVPGVTNKFLGRYVSKIGICFPEVADYFPKDKVVMTGNPRAQEVVKEKKSNILCQYGFSPKTPTVLIFGGSQGALKINQAVLEAMPLLFERDYQVLYVSGERYFEEAVKEVEIKHQEQGKIKILPYLDNMSEVLANIQLVVGRSGATSLAEITALGLPSILIPSPYVTNDHQTKNAESLVKRNAAKLLPNDSLTGKQLVATIDSILMDKDLLMQMSSASKSLGIPDAGDRFYQVLLDLI